MTINNEHPQPTAPAWIAKANLGPILERGEEATGRYDPYPERRVDPLFRPTFYTDAGVPLEWMRPLVTTIRDDECVDHRDFVEKLAAELDLEAPEVSPFGGDDYEYFGRYGRKARCWVLAAQVFAYLADEAVHDFGLLLRRSSSFNGYYLGADEGEGDALLYRIDPCRGSVRDQATNPTDYIGSVFPPAFLRLVTTLKDRGVLVPDPVQAMGLSQAPPPATQH